MKMNKWCDNNDEMNNNNEWNDMINEINDDNDNECKWNEIMNENVIMMWKWKNDNDVMK